MEEFNNVVNLYKNNFLQYASYVIKERALPYITDGLKPVQRRILHSLVEVDDSKFHKVANIIGHTMKYHPHGDAAIGDALVVLANKDYFIEKQGNFGNLLTGDSASAPRYIECRLTPLAKDVLYNKEVTKFVDSYDGRSQEPVFFPCKIPYILLHGAEGIAVGLATKILPHNFNEVLEAQIACLNEEPFTLYPDFFQGGLMDISEYDDGKGKAKVRAKIDKRNNKTLVIKEVPYGVTSEKLISSIEDAIRKNKVKISSISDFTTEKIEIELTTQRGITADEVLDRLYAYTDCEINIHANMNIIVNKLPKTMTVTEIIEISTKNLVEVLKAELRIKIKKFSDRLHLKTLEQIFIGNKLYKNIEDSETYESAIETTFKSIKKYAKKLLEREIEPEDIEKLLEIPIKRIAKFDIEKSKDEITELKQKIKTEQNHLLSIKRYTISFLKGLIKKYGDSYKRKTRIISFETVNARDLKDKDSKVYYDRANGFIGTKVKGDSIIECSSFAKILIISNTGTLRVIPVSEKEFCDKLVYFGQVDKDIVFNTLSRNKKTKSCHVKRFKVEKFILNKEYAFLDEGHRLECFTFRDKMTFKLEYLMKIKDKLDVEEFSFADYPIRGPLNKSLIVGTRKVLKMSLK